MTPQLNYSSAQVSRIALVSLRQLQWWDEKQLLSPAQEGHRRVYEPRELFAVMLFRDLKERGFSLRIIRRLWKQMQKQGFELPAAGRRWLLTDGRRVVFLEHPDVVLAFLEQRRNPAFVLVSLSALAQRIVDQPAPLIKRGPGMARSARPGGYLGLASEERAG